MQASKDKFSNSYKLLDAHVYAKIGDIDQECKSLLAFLRASFTDLATSELEHMILSIFYRSIFGLKIYNYKATHGGVLIPAQHSHYIDRDYDTDQNAKIVLPEVYVKQSSFSNVKVSIAWMASFLQGMNKSDEFMDHKHVYMSGLQVICCAFRNLDSQQLLEIKESITSFFWFNHLSSVLPSSVMAVDI